VNELRLRELLHGVVLPPSDRQRALAVIRQAFGERERVSWPRRHARALALAAAGAAIAAAAFSPPGRAVLGSLREAVGVEHAQPALFSLPAPGRLLVTSTAGSWVVSKDGSKRLLGRYREASWSPFGRFVVAARADELAALEPNGTVHWTLARPLVRFPRWTGTQTDTRIAYLAARALHVVSGDGTDDHVVAAGLPLGVAPAWRLLPSGARVLTYLGSGGRVTVAEPDSGAVLYRTPALPGPRALAWSPNGTLAVATRAGVELYAGRRRIAQRRLAGVVAVAFAPDGRLAVLHRNELLLYERRLRSVRRLFAGAGRLAGLVWSPDGNWLLVGWPSADQWLFVRSNGRHRLVAVSNVAAQFRSSTFPRVEGWCCAPARSLVG
jgi:hypothetical protein